MKIPIYKPLLLCIVLICVSGNAFGQSYGNYVSRADSLFRAKDYKGSVQYYTKAFEIKSSMPLALYDGACAAALAGSDQVAFRWPKLAIDNGWTNITHLKSDADLQSLHALPEWTTLVNDFQKKIDIIESKYDKALQKELLSILDDDQSSRLALRDLKPDSPGFKSKEDSLRQIIHGLDTINLRRVTKILDERGWVGPEVVGNRASSALFFVIQHADLATQVKYLPMMKSAVARKALRPDLLAMLEDRVALGQGRKQTYGSQVGTDETTGKNYILPLEDPKNVDARRESVGLEPISVYARRFGIEWDAKSQESTK